MAGIVLSIEVDDKGTVKVKQFADETRKAFEEMKKGPEQAKGSLDSLKESWVGITAKIALATAAFYTAKRMIYDTGRQIASAANDIERQSKVLGISTDELQKWQYAAKMSDVNAQELAIGIKLLSRNLEDASQGSGDASKYFSAMGISAKDTFGNLRPLNDVLGDIMDKFASWEDGPRKIAIALALFGRSGETLIPLLNKGRSGFAELSKEAERFGFILEEKTIKRGSEMEDVFKRWDEQWKMIKFRIADATVTLIDFLTKQRQIPGGTVFSFTRGLQKGTPATEYSPYEPGPYSPALITKPPTVPGKEGEKKGITPFEEVIREQEAWKKYQKEAAERSVEIAKWESDQITKAKITPFEEVIREEESFEKFQKEAAERSIEISKWEKDQEIEDLRESHRLMLESREEWQQMRDAEFEEEQKRAEMGETFAKNMASAWDFNLKRIVSESRSMGDALKNIFLGIGDAFSSTVSRMISDWMLFGNIKGEYKAGKGVIGWLGSILPFAEGGVVPGWKPLPFQAFAGGGIADRPTLGLIGEGGPEAFVPLKGGKIPVEGGGGKSNVNIVYIYAWDSQSLRDFVRRNPGPFLEIMTGDARAAGPMSKLGS